MSRPCQLSEIFKTEQKNTDKLPGKKKAGLKKVSKLIILYNI